MRGDGWWYQRESGQYRNRGGHWDITIFCFQAERERNIFAISFSAKRARDEGLNFIIKTFFFLVPSLVSRHVTRPQADGGAAGSKCSDLDWQEFWQNPAWFLARSRSKLTTEIRLAPSNIYILSDSLINIIENISVDSPNTDQTQWKVFDAAEIEIFRRPAL